MKQFYDALLISVVFLFCNMQTSAQVGIMQAKSQNHRYTANSFRNSDGTFGYTILDNGKKYIHQPTVPGRAGTRGFNTNQDAQKVAAFVITKMEKGIFPPSVSEEELKKLIGSKKKE